jgi:hypothetical protein
MSIRSRTGSQDPLYRGFDLDQKGTAVLSRSFFGDALASAPAAGFPIMGGFVMISSFPLAPSTDSSTFTADRILAPDGSDYPQRGTLFWHVVRQYEFRMTPGGPRFLFVQWAPDDQCVEACCQRRFDLYQLDDQPRSVSSNHYACDV